jgi:hypothetical protein
MFNSNSVGGLIKQITEGFYEAGGITLQLDFEKAI